MDIGSGAIKNVGILDGGVTTPFTGDTWYELQMTLILKAAVHGTTPIAFANLMESALAPGPNGTAATSSTQPLRPTSCSCCNWTPVPER
jgi:hypothetical protein